MTLPAYSHRTEAWCGSGTGEHSACRESTGAREVDLPFVMITRLRSKRQSEQVLQLAYMELQKACVKAHVSGLPTKRAVGRVHKMIYMELRWQYSTSRMHRAGMQS